MRKVPVEVIKYDYEEKRGPGRPKGNGLGHVMGDEHRQKIKNSQVLAALIAHAEGKKEMSGTRVTACLGLLKKVLPDLSSVELTGPDGGPVQFERIEWVIIDGSAKVVEHTNGASVPAITGPGSV